MHFYSAKYVFCDCRSRMFELCKMNVRKCNEEIRHTKGLQKTPFSKKKSYEKRTIAYYLT